MIVRRLVSSAAVLCALLGACTGSRPQHVRAEPGVPPLRFAPGVFNCPSGHGVPVFGRYVYGVEYPKAPPSTVEPSRCFATEDEARAAGFRPPPPPPGDRVVDGVYLEPTPRFVRPPVAS